MSEIRNKVKESGLIPMDLAEFKPGMEIYELDLRQCLWQDLVLKEKDFRNWIKENDWDQYTGKAVRIYCSSDAIIPSWAYMLISSELIQRSIPHLIGEKEELTKELIRLKIRNLNLSNFIDGRVIIKGCSDIPFPDFAMNELMKQLLPVTKSVMFGEPCSTVPVFKKK